MPGFWPDDARETGGLSSPVPPAAEGTAPGRWRTHRLTRSQGVRLLAGLVVAGGLLFAVFTAAGGVPAELAQLRRTQLAWLAPALLAEVISYMLFGAQLRRLGGGGPRLGWRVWTQVALVVYGLGRLTPAAPAEGVVFSAFELQRRGMLRRRAGLVLVLGLWTQFWALILVFAVGRAAAAGFARLNLADATVFAVSALMVAATVMAVTTLRRRAAAERIAGLFAFLPRRWRKSREELRAIGRSWHDDIEEVLGSPRTWAVVLLAATAGWASDAVCLWLALISAHSHVGFDLVILAYALASLASWVPLLPAGAGVVETIAPAVLHHFGVPLLAALAGTLIWRALSLLLPALAGAGAALILHATRPAVPGAGAGQSARPG